jgi:hypothetical protein
MNIKTGIAAVSITLAGMGGLAACGTGHPVITQSQASSQAAAAAKAAASKQAASDQASSATRASQVAAAAKASRATAMQAAASKQAAADKAAAAKRAAAPTTPSPSGATWVPGAQVPSAPGTDYAGGVTYGPTPSTYYVHCMEAQCTEEPDSGPLGTTCGQVSSDGDSYAVNT